MSIDKDFSIEKILSSSDEFEQDFLPIVNDIDEDDDKALEIPTTIPILPLRNMVIFPGVLTPISVARTKSLKLVKEAYADKRFVGAVAQRVAEVEEPTPDDLYTYGTIIEIVRILELPNGTTSIIVQGKRQFKINKVVQQEPYNMAEIELIEVEKNTPEQQTEYDAITSSIRDIYLKIVKLAPNLPDEVTFVVKNITDTTLLTNFVCINSLFTIETKQDLLKETNLFSRGIKLLELLIRELQMVELKEDIQSKVKSELNKQQREYLLNQQIKTIQNELGANPLEKEIEGFKEKAKTKKWSNEMAEYFNKEITKLQHLNSTSGEYSIQLNYINAILDLPWNEYTEDNFDMQRATEILDSEHYGLEKVKERILEHLAVLKLKGDLKSPILCLYGPPGVGKTSLGKSIAEALGRKYVRMSLGGLHDESEIRGHRRTYIGAMPGRIIENMRKAKSANPVFILDEIDKVSADYHGDPASALLEVLDPEQNSTFHDNYLDVDFDLSHVMFIATANNISSISMPLRDRMEMIDVSGYLMEEKIQIAKRHLVPKQLQNHGVEAQQFNIPDNSIAFLIENYTRESGVRELDKRIAEVVRKVAKKIVFGEQIPATIDNSIIIEFLGKPIYTKDIYDNNNFAGVVTGLAWTPVGGEILFVETSLSRGKGKLVLTGNLGNVMKESATLALQYIKANSHVLDINPEIFEKWDVHIHVPEGAMPKDGPSAGITMVTSLASALTQRKVKKALAMTGEITLRGKVLPVGGIREKILAAKRAGIKTIILCEENRKDIEEIKPEYIEGVDFVFVSTIAEVLQNALLDEKVDNPLCFD